MRLLVLLTFCLLGFTVTGCSFNRPTPLTEEEISDMSIPSVHTDEITNIIQDYAVGLKNDKRLHLEHANTYYNETINLIQLRFISQDIIEMCDARKVIIDLTEGMLARLNQNIIVGPEFGSFPFAAENLEIYIRYESFYGKYCDPYYIVAIRLEDGEVFYYTFDLLDHTKECWHVRRETYATSRTIVVFEREAERRYELEHKPKNDIFGNDRYIPEQS